MLIEIEQYGKVVRSSGATDPIFLRVSASLREKTKLYFLPGTLSGRVEIFFQISSPTCFPCFPPSSMAGM